MNKKHIITLLFFCVCGFTAVTMAREFFDTKDVGEEVKKEKVVIDIKEQAGSIVDNISQEISEKIEENASKEKVEEIIVEKIINPTEKIITERITEVINNTIAEPIKETSDSIYKKIITSLISLLPPEEIKKILNDEFDIDICKI
ncbi:MAG: hypothetical protein PHU17_01245 [Candidatus Pacebacteria bacterium]|nr:hypothetical protein [Candidatus Paceibacterota bacterium]MDD4074135.1 hypothetical protein [Candidatus Paceibacterota bacterium]